MSLSPVALDPHSAVLRPDPLAVAYARKRIDQAQYMAGREFQRIYQLADKRRPDQPEPFAADQLKAWQALTACYRELGQDGSAIVRDVLISGISPAEIAKARGLKGAEWPRYFGRRLGECLDCLAEVFGFSDGRRA